MEASGSSGSSASSGMTPQQKAADRLKKLKELHLKRNEARQLNHKEVVEEDKRSKLPANWEARKRKAEWMVDEEKRKDHAKEQGLDYDRVKLLNMGADEAERFERMKKKKNPDPGFSDYEQATIRQYNRLVRNMKPDMNNYQAQREKMGSAFYCTADTMIHGLHEDSKEGIDRMVNDLEQQIAKREKYSRRRTHNDDNDIDYINERNMKFNKKLDRFYGEYTTEIKQNLERGTAV